MSFKRSLCICAAALMLLSTGVTSATASTDNKSNHFSRSTRIARHFNNVKRSTRIKMTHARNVRRINRIKRHLINHQKNLIKLSKRINRDQRHHHNINLIKRLNNDKTRLIKAVENNERGMVRLAQTVANEEHQINLLRHPGHKITSVKPTNSNHQTTPNQPNINVHLPRPATNNSEGHSVMTFINEVNGKLTRYVAKDSGFTDNNGQYRSHSYSDNNGRYSATPDQITQNEMSQLNQQIQNQIQNSNHWFNAVNQDMEREFNSLF